MERFVAALLNETGRSKGDYEKAQNVSEKLMDLMRRRRASCASIADATLEIETLEDIKEIDIDQPLSTSNCISILKQSEELDCEQIYNEAFNFMLYNFIDVVKQSSDSFYRRMSPNLLEILLKSNKLKVKTEDDVIPVVKEWLEYDYKHRKKYATQLLKEIRFGCVTDKVLKEILADPSHIFMRNVESKLLLQNAIWGDCDRNYRECLAVRILAFGNDGKNLLFDSVKDTWEGWKGQKQDNGRLFRVANVSDKILIIGGQIQPVIVYPKCQMASQLQGFAEDRPHGEDSLNAAMLMPTLLLQQTNRNSNNKTDAANLLRRLELWREGKLHELVAEGSSIHRNLAMPNKKKPQSRNKQFSNAMKQGKLGSAISCLLNEMGKGVLGLKDTTDGKTVKELLLEKHPKARNGDPDSIVSQTEIEPPDFHPVLFDNITGALVRQRALQLGGSGGPSGADSTHWKRMLTEHGRPSDDLCNAIALVARKLFDHSRPDTHRQPSRLQTHSPGQKPGNQTNRNLRRAEETHRQNLLERAETTNT